MRFKFTQSGRIAGIQDLETLFAPDIKLKLKFPKSRSAFNTLLRLWMRAQIDLRT